jgi:hypothetical protein
MCGAGSRNHFLDVEFPTKAGVERSKAGGDVAAECSEMVDVVVKLATKALLVSFRELLGLSNRFVEYLGWHAKSLSREI